MMRMSFTPPRAGASRRAGRRSAADHGDIDLISQAARVKPARRKDRRDNAHTDIYLLVLRIALGFRRLSRSARYFARRASGSKPADRTSGTPEMTRPRNHKAPGSEFNRERACFSRLGLVRFFLLGLPEREKHAGSAARSHAERELGRDLAAWEKVTHEDLRADEDQHKRQRKTSDSGSGCTMAASVKYVRAGR